MMNTISTFKTYISPYSKRYLKIKLKKLKKKIENYKYELKIEIKSMKQKITRIVEEGFSSKLLKKLHPNLIILFRIFFKKENLKFKKLKKIKKKKQNNFQLKKV
jgi:hypothetical protein